MGSGGHRTRDARIPDQIEEKASSWKALGFCPTKAPRGDACDKVDVDLAVGVRLALAGKLAPALWALPHVVSLVAGVLVVSTG